jgi:hypothetical protein
MNSIRHYARRGWQDKILSEECGVGWPSVSGQYEWSVSVSGMCVCVPVR